MTLCIKVIEHNAASSRRSVNAESYSVFIVSLALYITLFYLCELLS